MPEATFAPVPEAPAPAESTPPPTSPAAPSLGQRMDVAAAGVDPTPSQDPAGAGTTAVAPESNWQGVRDFARTQGVELPYDDDGAALSALLNAHRQLQQRNYYADVGQRFAPYASQLRSLLEQQRTQQAQKPPAPAWSPPEFNKAWLQQVERDEATGLLRSRPGYDPAIAERVQAYADWREKFLESPETVVAPLVESRAQALIDARFAQHQERSSADRLVAGHSPWMFAPAPGGGRQLTPEGVLYAQAAKVLWDRGLKDVAALDAAATAHVESAVLRRRFAQAQGSAQQQQQQQPAGAVGGNAVRPAAGLPAAPPQSTGGLSLRALLNARLNGVPEDGAA